MVYIIKISRKEDHRKPSIKEEKRIRKLNKNSKNNYKKASPLPLYRVNKTTQKSLIELTKEHCRN